MPEFIESVYVHRPVREADIPRRGALSKRARGAKAKRAKATPASTLATEAPAMPPGLWSMTAREPRYRPAPSAQKGGADMVKLPPLITVLFFVWVALCFVFKLLG